MSTGPVTFDLSHLPPSVSKRLLPARVIFGVLSIVFLSLAVGLGLEAIYLRMHGPLDSLQWLVITVVESGLGAGIALGVVFIFKTGPGAVAVSVDERGIELEWPSGRREILTWEHPTSPYLLLDFTQDWTSPPQFGTMWDLRIRNRPPTPLSEEAFRGIIANARSLGLRVETTAMPNPAFWLPCQATRIRPPIPPGQSPGKD